MIRARILGILAACLLVLGAPLASACAAPPGVDAFDLPRGMRTDRIGDGLRIDGVETQAWVFRSTDDADTLAAWFGREWEGKIVRRRVGPWDVLSHREDDWLLTVQSRELEGSEGCAGFLSIARSFAPAARSADRRRQQVPRLPHTEVLHDIEAEDLGRRSRTLILSSEASASQNLEFYRAHFRSEGFVPIAAGALAKGDMGGSLSLNRGTEQVDLVVSEQDGRSLITIVSVGP